MGSNCSGSIVELWVAVEEQPTIIVVLMMGKEALLSVEEDNEAVV